MARSLPEMGNWDSVFDETYPADVPASRERGTDAGRARPSPWRCPDRGDGAPGRVRTVHAADRAQDVGPPAGRLALPRRAHAGLGSGHDRDVPADRLAFE